MRKRTLLNSFFLTLLSLVFSASNLWAQEVTFDFTSNEWDYPLSSGSSFSDAAKYNAGNIHDSFPKDGVEVVFKQGATSTTSVTGTNTCSKYFEASNVKHIRFFKNNVMKVFAPAGKAITKIAFEMNNATFNMTNVGAGELSSEDKTWTGDATYVKIKSGATNQIKTMVMTLADKSDATVTPEAEAEEKAFLDFNDPTIHTEFNVTSTTYFTEDVELIDGKRNDNDYLNTENLITTTIPWGTTTTKNGLYYGSGKVYLYLRTGKTTIKCDADKIIKNIKMTFYNSGSWNAGNTINGETTDYATLTSDGWTGNSNVVELNVAGATRIGSITFTIADKPAAEAPAPAAIAPTSFVPEDNSVLGNSFDAAFTAKFDEALTLDNEKISAIKLYKGSVDAANEIAPDVEWKARVENDKDLYIFSLDGDGFVQNIATEEGAKYILVIPAGIVKNTSDVANAELTLTLNGPAPTIKMVSADPANNSTKSSSFVATFNITFDKDITIDNSKASAVKLYIDEVGGTEIAPESGAWSLEKESDGKTLRVYSLDEYSEGPQMITPEAGKKYILVVPAGAVKNADGAENKEIKITLNGPVAPLVAASFDPSDNSVLGNYAQTAITAKFDESLTLDASKAAAIKFYKGAVAAENEIAPEAGAWTVQLQNSNKELYIFSLDEYGEGVQSFTTEEGQKYIWVIPAGIVQNASGTKNVEMTVTLNGPVAPLAVVSSDPADNSEKTAAFAATFNITFDKDITIDNTKAASVKLYIDQVGGTEIAPESGTWSLVKESDGKTLRIFSLDEYGEGPQFITPAEGKKYILVVPAGTVKNGESENKEIKITLNGPAPAPKLVPTSYDPTDGSTLASNFSAAFTANFAEELTLDDSKVASIKLFEKIGDVTTELKPDKEWVVSLEGGKKNLYIWASDYDGFAQGYAAKEGAKYELVIPAGIVKNADGLANEELTLTLNGPVPTVALVSTNPANNATFEAGYQNMSFNLTFDKAVSTTETLLNAGVAFTRNGVAVETNSWSFNLSNDNKTVQVYGKDMDGFTDTYQVAAGDVFVLTIAKDVFSTEAGAKSKEIRLTLNGPELIPEELVLESSTPADGTTLEAGYQNMSFMLNFAQAATTNTDKLNAGVTLTKNGTKVDVVSWGFNLSNGGKTVQLFGMDMDGFTDCYNVEEGDVFVLTIAKAVFTAIGYENNEIKITLNGPAVVAPETFNPTSITPGDGEELNKFHGNYAMPHLELTFEGDIVKVLADNPAIELRKGSADGEVLPISGWRAVVADENPNMLLIDAWDYNVGNNIWFEAENTFYYWVIPAGIVQNADGAVNAAINLKQKGTADTGVLKVVSTSPANRDVVKPSSYTYYQFYVTFENDIEIIKTVPNDVKFYENDVLKLPFASDTEFFDNADIWHAMKEDAKTLYIWGDDGYSLVDSYATVAGNTYKLVIPAGVVKDAQGNENGEITITFTCEATDGINAVKAGSKNGKRFNLNGVRINGSKKGLQILQTEDGRNVKVVVK